MSGTNFANVNNNGNANNNNASNSNGVRPISNALSFDGLIAKGKVVFGKPKCKRHKMPELPHDLPYAQRYDNVLHGV